MSMKQKKKLKLFIFIGLRNKSEKNVYALNLLRDVVNVSVHWVSNSFVFFLTNVFVMISDVLLDDDGDSLHETLFHSTHNSQHIFTLKKKRKVKILVKFSLSDSVRFTTNECFYVEGRIWNFTFFVCQEAFWWKAEM
jgi:hypothetical protein